MIPPEFDTAEAVREATAIFEQTKRDITPYPTEFLIATAQSYQVLLETERNYISEGIYEGTQNDIDELSELESKFKYDYEHIDSAMDSIVIDITGKDMDRINVILIRMLGSIEPELQNYTLQALHEVNSAFVDAGGEMRAKYAEFFLDDTEAA